MKSWIIESRGGRVTRQAVLTTNFSELPTSIYQTNAELGQAAAEEAAFIFELAIREKGRANAILATGNSQLSFLHALRAMPVDWSKVNLFHMDEYIGLDPAHPASFPAFLKLHLVDAVHPRAFFPIPASTLGSAPEVCLDYERLLRAYPADLCVLGIGENGHLAFNDPPFADFNDANWVKIVKLEEASRRQQVGERHFQNIGEVPTHAITLTIPALLAACHILALVPEARKADAVLRSLQGPISEDCPGSILRRTPHAHLYLDLDSAQKILPRESGG
jgi:glucosamine-6-phosphate deaminase